jgi:hypothetical protein
VRPHPTERYEPWLEAAADAPNVEVICEGSVVPWLAGARALIHNSCTSAVEAAVLGTAVLSYRPVTSDTYDNPLPNGVGIECFDDDSLIAAVKDVLEGGTHSMTSDRLKLLEHHVASMEGPLSCERILDQLKELPEPGRCNEWGLLQRLDAAAQLQKMQLKEWLRPKPLVRPYGDDRKAFQMNLKYVNERIARFQKLFGRFKGVRAKPLAKSLIAIE